MTTPLPHLRAVCPLAPRRLRRGGVALARHSRGVCALALCGLLVSALACTPIEPPATRETIHVHGDPYERGLAHGTQLRSKVRSFYTTMLTASLLPYVNREKPDIASALPIYAGDKYKDAFSYYVLLESAKAMEKHIGADHLDEMRGIADGAGMDFDQILILNTFVDTVMAVRGVALALRQSQSPTLESVRFVAPLASDKRDNDGDGETDESDEGLYKYQPAPTAVMVEVPTDATIQWLVGDPEGVDRKTIRAQLDERTYTHEDTALAFKELPADKDNPPRLQVTLTPEGGLPAKAVVSLVLMAGDKSLVTDPPPAKARFMRDERLAFTTVGHGKAPDEVANVGLDDGRSQPPASAFAVRGTATGNGKPLLAQHFSLLDANTSHKHTTVVVHHPKTGKPFVTVGWAGVIWGFSGMNAHGLGAVANYSDTLRNSVVNGLIPKITDLADAKLITDGRPIGLTLRTMLESQSSAAGAADELKQAKHTFGWNVLMADATGEMRCAEVDSMAGGRAFTWGPGKDKGGLDQAERPLASVGEDDLRIGVHFVKNVDDMFSLDANANGVPVKIRSQRGWSSYYFRSLRTFGELGALVKGRYGSIDVAAAKEMLGHKALVDTSDGMNAVVMELSELRLHTAMGSVPATDSAFVATEVPSK